MREHFFISDADGALHDTRRGDWASKPLRSNYRWQHGIIDTVADLKATLRAGDSTWPGGYPLYFITSDGEALSFQSVREEFRQVAWSIANKASDGWRVVACDVNWEDGELECSHSGRPIDAAYVERVERVAP